MPKPSDFNPRSALEVVGANAGDRYVWTLRIAGAVLLLAGWSAVALRHIGETEFIADTAIFAALGTYAFIAAARSRRTAVNMERKMRMELLVHNMELESMAMRDDLTQLFNRRFFFERLDAELRTARGFRRPLAVMVIDIDCLKTVNRAHGYSAGDRLLAALGGFLLGQTRGSDVPARIGGSEFAIILPDTAEGAATDLMERLVNRLEKAGLMQGDDLGIRVSASFGVSGYPWGGETTDAIMQQADADMHANKLARRGRDPSTLATVEPGGQPIPAAFRKAAEEASTSDDAHPGTGLPRPFGE